jgi:UDP-N-acetyl-D-mannosaminuronic acid dehydrogenase
MEEEALKVVVIGMGYVGIPCAALLADVPGFEVTGVQRRSRRSGWKIECLNGGKSPFEGDEPGLAELIHRVAVEKKSFRVTDDYAVCEDADVVLIDVQTPTDEDHVPRYASLRAVTEQVGRYLEPETLVVIESTVAPGTTENVVLPILERESGLTAGQGDKERGGGGETAGGEILRLRSGQARGQGEGERGRFYLAFSYERVMPGRLLEYITDFPRVVGGIDAESTRRAVGLYERIVTKEVSGTDTLTAEMSKVIENAYRDVNIAFANEMALCCERMGVDAFEVRGLINARPDRNVHRPGAGVGGHCLPKDSWLLKFGVETYGQSPSLKSQSPNTKSQTANSKSQIADSSSVLRLIPLAREINDSMPGHMVGLIEEGLAEAGRELARARVALLGVAYLENADDTRNTPAADLAALLQARGAEVVAHDPHVREADWRRALDDRREVALTKDLGAALAGADCAAVVTKHREYCELRPEALREWMRTPVVVDGRNTFAWGNGARRDVAVRAVGRGRGPSTALGINSGAGEHGC